MMTGPELHAGTVEKTREQSLAESGSAAADVNHAAASSIGQSWHWPSLDQAPATVADHTLSRSYAAASPARDAEPDWPLTRVETISDRERLSPAKSMVNSIVETFERARVLQELQQVSPHLRLPASLKVVEAEDEAASADQRLRIGLRDRIRVRTLA